MNDTWMDAFKIFGNYENATGARIVDSRYEVRGVRPNEMSSWDVLELELLGFLWDDGKDAFVSQEITLRQ